MFFVAEDGKDSESSSSLPCRPFEFAEIQLATDNFDESLVIGSGGFGKVYKGTIINGASLVVAAIKRLDSFSRQGAAEFWAEVETLAKVRHNHLVSLIGYCNDGKEMILVYEYMPHGTLEDHLHKLCTPLSWLQRLKICINAARGLEFLHTGMGIEHIVIHRDVKSSNILLKENWAAKISDFGLSRIGPKDQPTTYVGTKVKGTFGYLDPNYFRTGRLTRKSDVYAFGVVLFEVLCRKRAVDGRPDDEDWGLAGWAQESIKEGKLRHIIDYELRDQISPKCLKDFARTAGRCLYDDPKKRPIIAEVVFNLEAVLALQEKANVSLQAPSRRIVGRMYDMFLFLSKGEHSGVGVNSKLSNNTKGNNNSARNTVEADDNMFLDTREVPSRRLKVFAFADLKRATRNFGQESLLGRGGFGRMFIGWVDKNTFAPSSPGVGMAIIVKRHSHGNSDRDDDWLEEMRLLGGLDHPNIISLLGYCDDKQEKFLVYEYMYGCFNRFLRSDVEPLSWGRRLNIMMGVARGLTYLHSPQVRVIHHDVKSSGIFLDEDFNAKLGHFECARSGPGISNTHVMGTFGYLDPDYYRTGRFTAKSDVYSFGVVMLEALTGQRPFSMEGSTENQSLPSWIILQTKKNELMKIMDPCLEQNYPIKGAFECVELAIRCVAFNPKDRPSSEQVLQCLEAISSITSNGDTSPLTRTMEIASLYQEKELANGKGFDENRPCNNFQA